MSDPAKLTEKQRKVLDQIARWPIEKESLGPALTRLDFLEAERDTILALFADKCIDDAALALAREEGRREGAKAEREAIVMKIGPQRAFWHDAALQAIGEGTKGTIAYIVANARVTALDWVIGVIGERAEQARNSTVT